MIDEKLIEAMFQTHLDDKIGSKGTRRSFYVSGSGATAAARTAFFTAINLLVPLLEKQGQVLETVSRNDKMGYFCGEEVRQAQREVEEMIKKMGGHDDKP